MLSAKAKKSIFKAVEKYVQEDKVLEFLNELLNAKGTHSTFKVVIKDVIGYVENNIKSEE
ncbi:MAG: hypothetical protein KAS32_16925 [Candidatus Peribacteraceae bacterium]|nr:hypothetical protein [Candidatus Peribacteraceae bacterium]